MLVAISRIAHFSPKAVSDTSATISLLEFAKTYSYRSAAIGLVHINVRSVDIEIPAGGSDAIFHFAHPQREEPR
jgi:hypothetical protein